MNELVFMGGNGQAMTNSLLVAERFGKQHKHVIQAIKDLETSAENSADLFVESEYSDSYGRTQKMYLMNRDGFSLLVMGFTGKEALKFKMDFIAAFNKMESYLRSEDYILERGREILQRRLQAANQRVQMLEGRVEVQQEHIRVLEPKAEYTDEVLQSPNTYTFTQMAKELDFRTVAHLTAYLKKKGIIFRQSGRWMTTADHSGKGYTKTRTVAFDHSDGRPDTTVYTVWTEPGRRFLHRICNTHKLEAAV